ncbi:MAG: VOC family protein [Chloroflexota bacterium]
MRAHLGPAHGGADLFSRRAGGQRKPVPAPGATSAAPALTFPIANTGRRYCRRGQRDAQVGIPVTDQDRALEFYGGKLGFETRIDAAYGEGQRWVEVAPQGVVTSIALIRADEANPAGIDTGVRLTSEDAAADHATLLERGVDADGEVIAYPVPMFVFRDPDGNRLVIVEQQKDQ